MQPEARVLRALVAGKRAELEALEAELEALEADSPATKKPLSRRDREDLAELGLVVPDRRAGGSR